MATQKLKRRKRRNTYGREPAACEWMLAAKDWKALELALRHEIPAEVRGKIEDVVGDYLYLDQIESERVPVGDALKYLADFKGATGKMLDLLEADNPTRDVLRDYFCFDPERPEEDVFAPVAAEFRRWLAAADEFVESFRGAKAPKQTLDAWGLMICEIAEIVAVLGVPVTVSKGTDKSLHESPLVLFVMEIQSRLPPERRRHHTGQDGNPSYDATAGKVSRALSSRDVSSPKKHF